MRVCAFCGGDFSTVERAREHVIKRAWSKRLGRLRATLPMYQEDADKPGIANEDNDLDNSVEHFVMGEAQGKKTMGRLSEDGAFQISRWILKVC